MDRWCGDVDVRLSVAPGGDCGSGAVTEGRATQQSDLGLWCGDSVAESGEGGMEHDISKCLRPRLISITLYFKIRVGEESPICP